MSEVINFEDIEKLEASTEKPDPENLIISFAEMNEDIEDARILKAKFSLFAKKLIDEGFNDALVYFQMFQTANSMSCLHSESHGHFVKDVHEDLIKFYPELCHDALGIEEDYFE